MFLSKFWNFILVIGIACLASVLYLVPVSIDESKSANVRTLVVKDRLQVESVLKMEARSRLDTTIVFTVDQVIREQIAAASIRKDPADIPMEIKEQLLSQMRAKNDKLTRFKADILFAVDRNGIVLAQIGENERSSGYSLMGFPLVQVALRGYVRDDSWLFDGKLYRMAARPVIHGGKYVGAIIHGQKVDKSFTALLSAATDAQVGIFVEDHIVAVSAPELKAGAAEKDEKEKGKKEEAGEEGEEYAFATDAEINTVLLDEVFKDGNYNKTGRSNLILSDNRYYVVALKMVGAARRNNGGVVIIRRVPKVGGIPAFLRSINKNELSNVPWWKIGVVSFALLFLGIMFIYLEGDRPKKRFLKEVEAMVSKEGERLNIYLFRGKYRKIADSINRAIDKAVQVLVSRATSGAPSVKAILGNVAPDDRLSKPQFEIPGQISLDDIPPPPPGGQRIAGGDVKKSRTPTVQSILPPPSATPMPPPAPGQHFPAQATSSSPLDALSWGEGLDDEETRIYDSDGPQAMLAPVPQVPADRKPAGKFQQTTKPKFPPVPMHPPQPLQPPGAGQDQAYKGIFDNFYKTKVACGENVDNLTFDRFKATLLKQEQAIRERTNCRKVEFRVYVKAGKAALKASPIK
ncbi:MAG: MXAN_5187 family protein [Pseudomonadota bacterium]